GIRHFHVTGVQTCALPILALAVYCAQRNHREALMLFLTLTIICGVCFLGVKAIEYRHKIEAGLLWGERFEPPSPAVVAPAIPAKIGSASRRETGYTERLTR